MSADTPAALDAHAAGMGHLGDQADLLVADTADGADAAMPHTPRYEPSWFYQELPAEMIEQCLRPRSRGGIDDGRFVELRPELGDIVIFRGEACEHSLTPVTRGVRRILQIEFCRMKEGRH